MISIPMYLAGSLLCGAALFAVVFLLEQVFLRRNRQLAGIHWFWESALLIMVLPIGYFSWNSISIPSEPVPSRTSQLELIVVGDKAAKSIMPSERPPTPESSLEAAPRRELPQIISAYWVRGVVVFYLAAVVALLVWRAERFLLVRRMVSLLPEVTGGKLPPVLALAKKRLGMDEFVGLRDAGRLSSVPFACEVGRAKEIVFPAEAAGRMRERELEMLMVHELVHLRHGDQRWNLLNQLAVSIFWFNPFCYWLTGRCRLAREIKCDRAVLAAFGGGAAEYGAMLLDFAGRRIELPVAATGVGENYKSLKTRILSLSARRGALALLAAGLVATGAGLLSCIVPCRESVVPAAQTPPKPEIAAFADALGVNNCETPVDSAVTRHLVLELGGCPEMSWNRISVWLMLDGMNCERHRTGIIPLSELYLNRLKICAELERTARDPELRRTAVECGRRLMRRMGEQEEAEWQSGGRDVENSPYYQMLLVERGAGNPSPAEIVPIVGGGAEAPAAITPDNRRTLTIAASSDDPKGNVQPSPLAPSGDLAESSKPIFRAKIIPSWKNEITRQLAVDVGGCPAEAWGRIEELLEEEDGLVSQYNVGDIPLDKLLECRLRICDELGKSATNPDIRKSTAERAAKLTDLIVQLEKEKYETGNCTLAEAPHYRKWLRDQKAAGE